MSATLLVRSFEDKTRWFRLAWVVLALVISTISLVASRPIDVRSIVSAALTGSVAAGAAFAFFAFERRTRVRFAEAMHAHGFVPYVGEFAAGLPQWPARGFTLFEQKPYAVDRVFHHPGAMVRTFQGATGGQGVRYDVAGAVIRVPSSDGMRRWRETEGWQALAEGEWVIVWHTQYISPRQAGAFAEQVLGFARMLRGEERGAA
jgi:hypothetical protein